jgi:hypothetical protein
MIFTAKSATIKKLSGVGDSFQNENEHAKRLNSAVYVQKHRKNSVQSDNSDHLNNFDWSTQLKHLTNKQQERQYSTSIVPSSLGLNINRDTTNMSRQDIEDDILARQSTLIEKQKDLLEQSKKILELSKTNAVFTTDTNLLNSNQVCFRFYLKNYPL